MFKFLKSHIPETFRYYLISYFTELIFIIAVFAYKVNELWRTSDLTPLQLLRTIWAERIKYCANFIVAGFITMHEFSFILLLSKVTEINPPIRKGVKLPQVCSDWVTLGLLPQAEEFVLTHPPERVGEWAVGLAPPARALSRASLLNRICLAYWQRCMWLNIYAGCSTCRLL